MTTGLILVLAILVLGGVIATVGDRIGMKVGKARLSLFHMRPRQTATLITILTGVIISASTFGILFAVDDQLRTGVFELGEIQDELEAARQDLDQAIQERGETRADLRKARGEQREARKRLRQINESLQNAIAQQERTRTQLNRTRSQLNQIETNYQRAQTLLRNVSQQATSLRQEIIQLEADRKQQIAQRDREIAEQDSKIAEQDREIAQREVQLQELEQQRTFLVQEVQVLEQALEEQKEELQGLRQGNLALQRDQTLAAGIVRIVDPGDAPLTVDELLRKANQAVAQLILPGITNLDEQIIQVTTAEVEQLVNQIRDGQVYVVRVLSARNYVVGEPCVLAGEECILVYASAALNRVVFNDGEIIAAISIDPNSISNERLIEGYEQLIEAVQFRAQQAGVLSNTIQIAEGRADTVIAFFNQLMQYTQPIDIQAIAVDSVYTYTTEPIRLDLVAVQNQQVLFSTRSE
jgi:uncharacterized protein (DUF3084 family)